MWYTLIPSLVTCVIPISNPSVNLAVKASAVCFTSDIFLFTSVVWSILATVIVLVYTLLFSILTLMSICPLLPVALVTVIVL